MGEDLFFNGERVLASRLGYRITEAFAHDFLGRIFNCPTEVFNRGMLQPETQDLSIFVDGVKNICEAQAKAARAYISDGTIEDMCPPLKAVLYIMADGQTPEGHSIESQEVRSLFSRQNLLESSWYRERLQAKQLAEQARLSKGVRALEDYLAGVGSMRATG